MRPCCVPGCTDKTVPRHAIPTEPRVRDIWIQRVANPRLFGKDDPKFLKNYVVCNNHFAAMCMDGNSGKLLRYSLPTITLPGYDGPSTRDTCFSYPRGPFKYITPEKVREALRQALKPRPSSDQTADEDEDIDLQVRQPQVDYSRKRTSHHLDFDAVPSTSKVDVPPAPPSQRSDGSVDVPQFEFIPGVSILPSTPTPEATQRKMSPGGTRGRGLLRQGGVSRQSELTPKAKFFYQKAKKLQQIGARYKAKQCSVRQRLRFLDANPDMLNCLKDVNPVTASFFQSQQRNQKYKPRGRRFNLEDKILALSILKQSGKAYRYLSRIFALPSRKVLSGVLNNIPFNCGINEAVFKHLKNRVDKLSALGKYCVLMFDEISLEPGVQYNQRHDFVEGFVDFGGIHRRASFADHALLFLIKGIHKKWKMPICFSFCESTTPTADLVRICKEVVRQVRQTGLHIVSTISDQGATNRSAINTFLEDTNRHFAANNLDNRLQGYLIDDEEIVHLYDFPHLMKGIRNSLLDKDLHFTQNGVEKVASWAHVVKLYEMDKKRGAYSQFIKLSDEHVVPSKIKKMRVKNCTQVFSHTVGTAMHVAATISSELSPESEFYLDPKASDTADLLLFFDKLFDSVNGSLTHPGPGKELRSVVTQKSQHISFWQSCIPVLDSMYFTARNSSRHVIIPSIKNWIFSLRGLIYLAPKLFAAGFKQFAPRSLNQDPIENYFSCIRSHGVRNTNPTCSSFISSNKALLVNNFVSLHSVGSNCEEDESDGVLDNLRAFIEKQKDVEFVPPLILDPVLPAVVQVSPSHLAHYTSAYVAGFVAKKMIDVTHCDTCNSRMSAAQEQCPENVLIRQRQFEGCRLTYPSSNFSCAFRKCTDALLRIMPFHILAYGVKEKLILAIESSCLEDILILFCPQHEANSETFLKTVVNVVFHYYLKNLNGILKGTDVRAANQDPLTLLAFEKFKRTRRKSTVRLV